MGESTKRWSATCCRGTRHKIPPHFPTFPHIFLRIFRFEQNTTVHDARAVGWERFIVLSLRRARQSYTLNVSQSYTTLHPSACLAILQLSAAILHFPAIPSNLAKLAEKDSFELKPKPSHVDTLRVKRERFVGANILQVFTYIRSHTFDNP